MEGDKRPRMQVEEMSKSPCRNPSVGDDIHLSILKELDGLVEVRRFKERDSKISTLLQLWASLITNPTKTDYISKAFFSLFRKTTVAVLSPDWMSVTLSLKEKLVNAIDIAGQALKLVIEDSLQLCNVLRRTAQEPWKHKSWKHILEGSLDIDDPNVHYCLAAEPEDVLLGRVQFLAQSGCERQAMSLAKCCFKFFNRFKKGTWPTRTHDTLNSSERQGSKVANYCGFSSMEWFLFLLQKKNKLSDIVRETASLSCHEGLQLIKFLRRKSTSDPLCLTLTNIFLVRDFMFPSKYCCTKELIVQWVSLHEKRKMNDIADAVRKLLVSYASTSAHFYLFVDVLWEQFGSKLLSLYVEMYVRGLTADVNFLEVARSNEMRETVQELETHISNVWHKLSTLFNDSYNEVARECMLSAFSLRPTQERLYILQSLTHSILSESQMKACSSEEQETTTSMFVKFEKCRNPNYRCNSSCSNDAENCSTSAESNQGSPLHPLLRRGVKGISYALVNDLVSLLDCVRCKTFQFNYFDWYKRSSELGDYLNSYIRSASTLFYNEDMGYPKSHPLFHHGGDDMDTESPSDEDIMDYESPASHQLSGNFPLVSSEDVSIHQSPLTVSLKQEQTSWAHSKSESVPPLKLSPLFVDSIDFAPKGMVKHPPHICRSSKSSFNPLMNSSFGTSSDMTKDMHDNFMNTNMRNMHMEHRHTTKSVRSPHVSNLTVVGATEALSQSVIMSSTPVSDGFASTSNSFLTHKSNSGVPNFGMEVHGSHMSTVHSSTPQYSSYPHDMSNPHVKSPEIANLMLNQMKQRFSSSAGIHQSKPLPSCMPTGSPRDATEAFAPMSNINNSIQNVSRTASNINVSHSVFSQNIAMPNNLKNDIESGNKVHGHHVSSNYIPQGNMHSSPKSLLLSTQEQDVTKVLSNKEVQGNMLMSLLENRKIDLMRGTRNDSSTMNSSSHKVPERLLVDNAPKSGNLPDVPLSFPPENKPTNVLPETTNLKPNSLNLSEQASIVKHATFMNLPTETLEGQVCSKIPIPVTVTRIPITKIMVEQLNSQEEKKTIPVFKISMPPNIKSSFRNWFFPANLVIPKNSNNGGGDSASESNSECLLEGNVKSSENNAVSIPGFIVFKSNKDKYFSSPKVMGESGDHLQKKIWTLLHSQSGEVASGM